MGSDDQDTNVPRISPFESIRRVADDGSEYWSARERGIARATARVAPTIYESRKPFRSMVGATLAVALEAICLERD